MWSEKARRFGPGRFYSLFHFFTLVSRHPFRDRVGHGDDAASPMEAVVCHRLGKGAGRDLGASRKGERFWSWIDMTDFETLFIRVFV